MANPTIEQINVAMSLHLRKPAFNERFISELADELEARAVESRGAGGVVVKIEVAFSYRTSSDDIISAVAAKLRDTVPNLGAFHSSLELEYDRDSLTCWVRVYDYSDDS